MISFNESISSNINGYSIDIRSTTRDYIDLVVIIQRIFSNWTFRVGGLEKISFINHTLIQCLLNILLVQNLSWKFNEEV